MIKRTLEQIRRDHNRRKGDDKRLDDDGQWITTENGHKVHINGEGVPDKGNPQVISKMTGGSSGKGTAHKLIFESHSVKAKNEKEAVSEINKGLKEEGLGGSETGSYKKVIPDKTYGGYTVTDVMQFKVGEKVKTRSSGSEQGHFTLEPDGKGNYVSKGSHTGYSGQD